jgi:hypothetical protein
MNPHMVRARSYFSYVLLLSCLCFFCSGPVIARADERLYQRRYDTLYDYYNRGIRIDIECHSGTPPVLEWVLESGKKEELRRVSFDFESDGEIDLTLDDVGREVLFRGVPYRNPGTYLATVFIETVNGKFMREHRISYTDFVWGRDNFRFANDGTFENSIGFVSETLVDWAHNRFGDLSTEQKLLLIYLMYSIYKGSIGRCYGFAGGESYYHSYPEALPRQYGSVYEIDEADGWIVKQMDYLQNDIVFTNFVTGRIDIEGDQEKEELVSQLEIIRALIEKGDTVIMPYLSVRMHHSMVVYGYIEDLREGRVTLVTANNWERDQENNTYSEDAENIVVDLSSSGHNITWYDLTKKRHRYPDKIYAIPNKTGFVLDREDFLALLERTRKKLIANDRIVLMVEEAEQAYIVDGEGKQAGYKRPRTMREIQDIDFKKIDYNYVFEVGRGEEYLLHLAEPRYNKQKHTYKRVNLFCLLPGAGGLKPLLVRDIDLSQQCTFRIDGETSSVAVYEGEEEAAVASDES